MTQQLLVKSTTAAWFMTQSVNYLLHSVDFTDTDWSLASTTLTAGQTDPLAGTNAYTMTATSSNASLWQVVQLSTTEANRTFSIYVKRKTGTGTISITTDGVTYENITIDGTWQRFDTTKAISGLVSPGIKIATSADEIYIAFAQLEDGLTPTSADFTTTSRYTVTQITDGDYPANTVRGAVFLDGRFFVMTPSGEIYQSALENAASWSSLEFIQSQNDPSNGVFIAKTANYVVALKEWAIEFFYDAANPTGSILSPVMNATVPIGCAADRSVQDLGGVLVFMGQTKNGLGRTIIQLSGASAQKISTPQIEKILDSSTLATVHSWSAQIGSHLLYGITLVDLEKTLVYDFSSQLWSFFTYLEATGGAGVVTAVSALGVVTCTAHGYSDGDIVKISGTLTDFDGWHVVTQVTANTFQIQTTAAAYSGTAAVQEYAETYFPIVASVRADGRQYMQDATSGTLYEFAADTYVDDVGAIAARIRTPKLDDGSTKNKQMAKAELIGDKIDSIAVVRWSDDDYATYSTFRPVDLDLPRSQIRRLGDYRRRAFEVLHVKNALLRVEAIEI